MMEKKIQQSMVLEILAITLILILISFPRIINTPFHIDESSWIGHSYFFEDWFRFDPNADLWQTNGKTLGDPNMTKFIIAVGRIITGFSPDALNKPYDYTLDFTQNSDGGHIPHPNLLYASRIPMAALIVMVGIFLFVQFYQRESRTMAYAWIFLLVQNTLLLQVMSRAMNEAPVLLFTVVSTTCAYLGFKALARESGQDRERKFHSTYFWFLLAGVSFGMAFSTKINSLLIFVSTITILAIQLITMRSLPRQQRIGLFFKVFLLYGIAAWLVIILLHPFLYRNPVGGIFQMITYRFSRLTDQSSQYTDFSQLTLLQRWWEILQRLFTSYTAFDFDYRWLVNLPLALVGFIILGKEIVVALRHRRFPGYLPTLITIFAPLVAAGFLSPLDWDRYFLFPVFIMTLVYAKGIEGVMVWLYQRISTVVRKNPPETQP